MEKKAFMVNMIQSELEDAVGVDNVSMDPAEMFTYGVDYFWISRMWVDKGLEPPKPEFIVRPKDAKEVSKVLKIANYYKLPVHTWGGGSGSQGSALPMTGGIILDVKRMNRILDYSEVSRTITAESGAIFQHVEWYANERGYSIMHIPSCLTCGTVGGALAHRGIGIMSTKYGKIDDQCISLEVVLPNGDIINTLPVPKHAAGPDLQQIFIGSEGTLGVITKAVFKLVEIPECRKFRAFLFKDFSDGLAACREIVQKIKPSIIRLFDEAETVSIIKKVIGIDSEDMKKVQLLANVGIMQGADSLSRMIGKRVDIAIPEVRMLPIEKIPASLGKVDDVMPGFICLSPEMFTVPFFSVCRMIQYVR